MLRNKKACGIKLLPHEEMEIGVQYFVLIKPTKTEAVASTRNPSSPSRTEDRAEQELKVKPCAKGLNVDTHVLFLSNLLSFKLCFS